MRPPTRFIVLFLGRTGSTYLMDMLDRHRWIRARPEVLVNLKEAGHEAQAAWMRRLYTRRPPWVKAVGHKTKLWDVLDPDGLRAMVHELGVRVIAMRRREPVRAVISSIRSHELYERTGLWELRDERDRPGPTRIDPDQLLERLGHWDAAERQLDAFIGTLDTPKLDLWYEDLLDDRDAELARVGSFLGVRVLPRVADRSPIRKLTPADLRDAVANYDEIRDHLARSEGSTALDAADGRRPWG